MALPPHWLDEVFEFPDTSVKSFLKSDRLWRAFEKAKVAYEQQKEAIDKTPNLIGPSPAQSARQAFLDSLDLQAK